MLRDALPAAAFAAALVLAGCGRAPLPDGTPTFQGPDPTWLAAPAAAPADPSAALVPKETVERMRPDMRFQLGVEAFAARMGRLWEGQRVVVLTTPDATIPDGRHGLELLLANAFPNFARVVLVVPKAGMPRPAALTRGLALRPGIAVSEVAAPDFRPTPSMLAGAEVLVIDLPATGLRHTGEFASIGAFLEDAAARGARGVLVLDRPTDLDARIVDGPLPDRSATGTRAAFLPTPPMPGLTPGEAARLFNGPYGIQADLTVEPMTNWTRGAGDASPRMALELARDLVVGTSAPLTLSFAAGALTATPTARTAEEYAAAISAHPLAAGATFTVEGGAVVVRPDGDVRAASLAAALAAPAWPVPPKDAAPPADLGLFGARWIFQAAATGATAPAWQRFWLDSQPYKDYLEDRQSVLLYPQ